MTPETAKQKIEALLELGTLKGVKVEYENEVTTYHRQPMAGESIEYSFHALTLADEHIKSIEPIPLEPKLLGPWERVRVISGKHKNRVGVIYGISESEYTLKLDDTSGIIYVSIFHVIPESLLVEEESEPIIEFDSKLAPGLKEYKFLSEVEEALEQVGYQVMKKV